MGVGDNPGVTVFVGVAVLVVVLVGVLVGVGGGIIESEQISIIVPNSPPGPDIVNVVKDDGFEIVNVPPPFSSSGDPVGQYSDVITFPLIVAQQ